MDVYVVIEEEFGECYINVYNDLEMAKKYAEENCTGRTRIEQIIVNVNDLVNVSYVDEEGEDNE